MLCLKCFKENWKRDWKIFSFLKIHWYSATVVCKPKSKNSLKDLLTADRPKLQLPSRNDKGRSWIIDIILLISILQYLNTPDCSDLLHASAWKASRTGELVDSNCFHFSWTTFESDLFSRCSWRYNVISSTDLGMEVCWKICQVAIGETCSPPFITLSAADGVYILFWMKICLPPISGRYSLMHSKIFFLMMMMMMNCFCGMVGRRKAFSLISSRDHCQWSSPSRISDMLRAGFEPAQNLSSGLIEWSCAVVITTTPRRH